MPPEPPSSIVCATYTHARRHPMVLGRIAGWTPPFQLTVAQIAVLLSTFLALVWSWDLWAPLVPDTLAMLSVAALPTALAWAVRRVRVEGRSLPRAALGWLQLLARPRGGTVRGKPHRPPRAGRAHRLTYLASHEP